jgi:hypothetical protein
VAGLLAEFESGKEELEREIVIERNRLNTLIEDSLSIGQMREQDQLSSESQQRLETA